MDYIFKDLGVTPQVCETIKQKGISKQTFIDIINSNAGNSYQKRIDLSKITGLQNDKIMAICDRIRLEIKNSQSMSSSLPIKQSFTQTSSSTMIKANLNAGGPSSSKRISALLKQPANKPIQSSTPLKLLQKSSFVVQKPIIPQSSSQMLKAEHVEQLIKVEAIVQVKVEPMKSPTDVKTILMDTTVADSGDSANAPSEGELHSAPAQFVTAAPVLEQIFPIAELQKEVDQGVDQIFAEDSDTESEMSVKEEQHQVADVIPNESIEKVEILKQPEDDQLSLSSSEDEMLVEYQNQLHQIDLNQQFQIEIELQSQSSSSSGTLSPIRSNQATQNDFIAEQEVVLDEENIQMDQSDQEIALQHEDGPSIEERQRNFSVSDDKMDNQEAPIGFIIQGLEQKDNQNEDQMLQRVQDQIMQEPDQYTNPVINEEPRDDFQEIQEPLNSHQDSVQEQKNEVLELQPQIAIEVALPLLQKVQRVDMGMQCDPWEPQVVYVEAEKKSMKNKKLQVTPERIEKSFKSPNSQQEEEKSSPMSQNDEMKRDSSSSNKGNYSASRTFVPGRTLIIPTVNQFSQSSVRTSSVQTSEFNQDQELTLSQLLEDTDFKSRPTYQTSYSQMVPKVKSILKRFHHERDEDSFTQLDSKRVKWDPNVEEKIQKPGEESYIKRFMFQKKKQQRQALHQAQADDSLSSDEENQFYDEDEEDQEEEEIIIQKPQPKRRIAFVTKDENDIKRDSSSEEEETGLRRNPPKAGSGSKVRHNWANGIKHWLNDMSSGKKSSSSQ